MTASIKALSDGLSGELQVGGNPSLRFGADTSGQLAGFRNRIINGNFDVWQRGTSFTVTGAPAYTADRWLAAAAGANLNIAVGGTNDDLTVNGAASNTFAWIAQRIEAKNARSLAGSKITVSFQIYTAGVSRPMSIAISYANAADNFSGVTYIDGVSFNSNANAYTNVTFTTSAVLPANVANGIDLTINFTSGVPSGTAVAFTYVQLELGSIATPFEQRPYGLELSLCQRYYEICNAHFYGYTPAAAAAVGTIAVQKVNKRGAITLGTPTLPFADANFTYTTSVVSGDGLILVYGTGTATGTTEFGRIVPVISEL